MATPRAFPYLYTAGFTLLEVLVALVIVGTALGASLRAVGSLTQNSSGLRASMMASWSAENRLNGRPSAIVPSVARKENCSCCAKSMCPLRRTRISGGSRSRYSTPPIGSAALSI